MFGSRKWKVRGNERAAESLAKFLLRGWNYYMFNVVRPITCNDTNDTKNPEPRAGNYALILGGVPISPTDPEIVELPKHWSVNRSVNTPETKDETTVELIRVFSSGSDIFYRGECHWIIDHLKELDSKGFVLPRFGGLQDALNTLGSNVNRMNNLVFSDRGTLVKKIKQKGLLSPLSDVPESTLGNLLLSKHIKFQCGKHMKWKATYNYDGSHRPREFLSDVSLWVPDFQVPNSKVGEVFSRGPFGRIAKKGVVTSGDFTRIDSLAAYTPSTELCVSREYGCGNQPSYFEIRTGPHHCVNDTDLDSIEETGRWLIDSKKKYGSLKARQTRSKKTKKAQD